MPQTSAHNSPGRIALTAVTTNRTKYNSLFVRYQIKAEQAGHRDFAWHETCSNGHKPRMEMYQ
jgi:hypothetical protein